MNKATTNEFISDDEERTDASKSYEESLSDLSVVSISSQDASICKLGATQASSNVMLVFSGGNVAGSESAHNKESPKLPKRRNAIDESPFAIKKLT